MICMADPLPIVGQIVNAASQADFRPETATLVISPASYPTRIDVNPCVFLPGAISATARLWHDQSRIDGGSDAEDVLRPWLCSPGHARLGRLAHGERSIRRDLHH